MGVPLASIFAQQPPLAAVRTLVTNKVIGHAQLEILNALNGVNDVYKEQILKLLVTVAEQNEIEVDPDIWEVFYSLKAPSTIANLKERANEPAVIKFDLGGGASVYTTEDRSTLVRAGGTGHRTWESSLAITEYICNNLDEFSELDNFIELGAGTGLVSLALAKLSKAKKIFATDGSPLVVDRLIQASSQNNVSEIIKPMVLDWDSPEGFDELPQNSTVLAGDILYGLTSSYPHILGLIEKLQPQRVILSNPVRNEESYEMFKQLCYDRGYQVEVLSRLTAKDEKDTNYMFIVSVPPIPVETIAIVMQ